MLGSADKWASGCQYLLGDQQTFSVNVIPYGNNEFNDVDGWKYGGSSAAAVYQSATSAYQSLADFRRGRYDVHTYPEVGGGLVTDGVGSFVLAGTHDYWYAGRFGNIVSNPVYNEPGVNIAKALAGM